VVDYSETRPTVGINTTLRWVLAPFGAVAAFGLAFIATFLVFAVFYSAEMEVDGSAPYVVRQAVATIFALVAWTWSGSRIAPPAQRKLALILFSAPVVMLAVLAMVGLQTQSDMQPGRVASVVGTLLACAGILVFGFHPWFAPRVSQPADTLQPQPIKSPRRPVGVRPAEPARGGRESRPVRLAILILRWVLAPFGAAAAAICALAILYQLSVYLFGKEDVGRGGGAEIIVLPVIMSVVLAWAWAGASIAPRRHRRWALIVFAVPPALFSCVALLPIASQWLPPGRIMIGVGSLLGSAVVFAIASHPRFAAPLAARFETYVPSEEPNSAGEPELSQDFAPSATTETRRPEQVASTTSFGARNRSISQASNAPKA
jgi:hypothetical protein